MKKIEHIVILTGLPFIKKAQQSMLRFVRMLLNNGVKIDLFSAGSDTSGENVIKDDAYNLHRVISIAIEFTSLLNNIFTTFNVIKNNSYNHFHNIKSEDIISPYGKYTFLAIINKWIKYFFILFDNFLLTIYLIFVHFKLLKSTDVIMAYETNYTIAARMLSTLFGKKYLNKFQGTILKATNRDKGVAIKYFPHNYFTLNKSDLCIMVNDGTDGKYYAKSRGCNNIIFEPHGVFNYEKGGKIIEDNIVDKLKRDHKFVLFNNASGSTWKRSDRTIRALTKVDKKYLKNIRLLTTYYAIDKEELIEYTKDVGLEDVVIFLPRITPAECNYIIRKTDVVIMTNDFSNLGNPILESIYYHTPIISINDGSLNGFVKDGEDALLIDLNKDFDKNMAQAIEKLYKNPDILEKFRKNLNKNNSVKELSVQQEIEFNAIMKQL